MLHNMLARAGLFGFVFLYTVIGANAALPLIGNTWLTGYDGAAYNNFGFSLDMTPDGKTVLVGANGYTNTVAPGAAYIFTSLSTLAGKKLVPGDPSPGGRFGSTVALSDNGTTAVVGSPGAKAGTNYDKGAVYIFTSAGGWTQQAKLVDPVEASETFFGCAVDISDDGNTVIIGSCSNPHINQMISSVYIYVRQNGNWSLQKKQLRGNDTQADDSFGGTVALSGDGNTALVGAAMATVNMNNDRGAAYVFVRNGTTWAQQAKVTAADGAQWDMFGNVVDLSNDGNTAIVGDSRKDSGAAYVFSRNAGSWGQQAKLTAADPDPYNSIFANSVALSNNGTIAVIGDYECARIFVRTSGTWSAREKLTTNNSEAYGFGESLALADDGQTILVGASSATVSGSPFQGSAYIFRPYVPMTGPNMLLLKSP
ncbi:MAG: hypothetical protein Q7U64_11170 [Desulfocapsaceae bacterium]|nr:hypothetical protein [Desulfocapsaceae bacterium]